MMTPNLWIRFYRLPHRRRRVLPLALAAAFSLTVGGSLAAAATAKTASGPASRAPRKAVTAAREILPFIKDDYPRALAEARARKSPIFIDAWAPW